MSSIARHSKSVAPRRLLSGVRSLPKLPISKTHLHREETSSHPADNTHATDPRVPVNDHDVKRATLHTRQDMVLLVTHLAFLNAQAETIDRRSVTMTRLLWAIVVVLFIIAIRV
jgi:hypothetical protein